MNGPVLRDIHVPTAPWWPLAPGWWLLLGMVVLICAIVLAWRDLRHRRGPLRTALREIDSMETAHARDGDAARLADRASRLLRRVARRIDPAVAGRDGVAWRAFLDQHARDAATRKALDDLIAVRFRMRPELDAPALLAALRRWCRDALRGHGAYPCRFAAVLRARRGAASFVPKGGDAQARHSREGARS